MGSRTLGPPAESSWRVDAESTPEGWTFGGGASLATLHERYRRRLEAIAFRILRNRADAEDVVQGVFLRLPKARFRGDASVWTYLYRAAVNTSVNVLRARRRRDRLHADAALAEPEAPHPTAAANPASPEHQVLEGEILGGVAKALLAVKPQHRRVLVMRIVHGLSNAEIARREDIPIATVGTWLRRGRAELAKAMGPMLEELEEDRS